MLLNAHRTKGLEQAGGLTVKLSNAGRDIFDIGLQGGKAESGEA